MRADRKLAGGAGRAPRLDIPFDIAAARASKLEVVCSIEGLRGIAVSGVTIAERPPGSDPVPPAAPKRRGWLRRGA